MVEKNSPEYLKDISILKSLIHEIASKYGSQEFEIIQALSSEIRIPVSAFCTELSSLEVICRYLKEYESLNFSQIARRINRSPKTVWHAFNSSKKKRKQPLTASPSKYDLPLEIISDRRLSTLEAIVYYLKSTFNLSLVKIGEMIKRNQRTIWTIYNRANKKVKDAEQII